MTAPSPDPDPAKLAAFAEQIAVAVLTHGVVDKPFNQDWAVVRGEIAQTLADVLAVTGELNAVLTAVKAPEAPTYPLRLVRVDGDVTGAVYAVGPGVFRHVPGDGTIDAGAGTLWAGWSDIRTVTAAQRDQLVAFTAAANGPYVPPVTAAVHT